MHISDILKIECIDLQSKVTNKQEAIDHAIDLICKSNAIADKATFKAAVLERESQGSTGFGNGIAIPHAKSSAVKQVSLCALVIKQGIDFDSLDGEPVNLIFLIASPISVSNEHLDVLAHLSSLLIDASFKDYLINAQSQDEFLSIITMAEQKHINANANTQVEHNEHNVNKAYDIVAVTACPAGLSHTYLAAEALETKAKHMGINIKVETDGAAGKRNVLTATDIAKAKAVIVAADRAVEQERFIGKPMVKVSVIEAVKNPQKLIEQALSSNCEIYNPNGMDYKTNIFMRLYRHLMSGINYLLPLVATAGILFAISYICSDGHTLADKFFTQIAVSLSDLILPILSAFVSFSIGGRLAIVSGLLGGVLASIAEAGVIGSLVNGFAGGYISLYLSILFNRYLKAADATMILILYPILSAIFTSLFAQFISNDLCHIASRYLYDYVVTGHIIVEIILGIILAVMMSTNMGGPLNKIAYSFGVLMLADALPKGNHQSSIMLCIMLTGMIAPLSCGFASLISKTAFSKEEKSLALKTIGNGLLFISEAAIPYLKQHGISMRLAFACGAMVTGVLTLVFDVSICSPHGGIFVLPLSNNPLLAVLFLSLGVIISSVLSILFRCKLAQRHNG